MRAAKYNQDEIEDPITATLTSGKRTLSNQFKLDRISESQED